MWSLKGREGFGFLSPSHRACEAGFNDFEKMKHIFYIALGGKFGEVSGVFLTEKNLSDALTAGTERWACASGVLAVSGGVRVKH